MNQPLMETPYPLDALPEPLKSAAIAAAHLAGVPDGIAVMSLLASLAIAQGECNVAVLGEDLKSPRPIPHLPRQLAAGTCESPR